jgi:DNA helicase-2/ATP-dependent DNA helicase PcrA
MTVHQAKGMEFPVVFLPCMQKNRFPAKKQANRVWKHLPPNGIVNAARYDTGPEDERRLLYVALTRSEKYLFCTWAPDAGNQLYRRPSPFWEELTRNTNVLTRAPAPKPVTKLQPEPRRPLVNVELSFSELKYFFECPYQFKLRFLYGFNAPLHEALGYGRSLHNALAEIHRRALAGETIDKDAIPGLLDTHLHVRYAYDDLEKSLRGAAEKSLARYLGEHGKDLDKLVHAEETIELTLPGGIVVNGRIDLIKRSDTNETIVVDFKSVERAQAEEITRLQLHVYALGYEQRFGKPADLVEIHNLDQGGSTRETVDDQMKQATAAAITQAGQKLRDNQLDRLPSWCDKCRTCDLAGICRERPAGEARKKP